MEYTTSRVTLLYNLPKAFDFALRRAHFALPLNAIVRLAMPAIRVSKEVAGRLCALLNRRDAGSEPSLATLKGELDQPPRPTVKEAHYAGGTVLTHTCLIDVARWANKEGVGQAQQYSLESLLRGAEVAIPIKPKPERVSRRCLMQ